MDDDRIEKGPFKGWTEGEATVFVFAVLLAAASFVPLFFFR